MLRAKLTKICLATTLAAAALVGFAIPGWGDVMINGLTLNGLTLNGLTLNGREAAGLTVVEPDTPSVWVEGGQLVIQPAN
ncbi:MAG: hypothetical protein VKO01_05325 [Cyanobacteriota bacterium]|nr:hypothetical protein [Cyanobacteriota bacterium]